MKQLCSTSSLHVILESEATSEFKGKEEFTRNCGKNCSKNYSTSVSSYEPFPLYEDSTQP